MSALPEKFRTCYPFRENWLELPDGKMHYVDTLADAAGAGENGNGTTTGGVTGGTTGGKIFNADEGDADGAPPPPAADGSDGRTVLLLHGNPTWSFLWRDLMRSLDFAGLRCVAPDLLGMGLSEKPDKFFRLADRIAHVEQLVARLGLKKFHLVVHDWGGAIGMGVAGAAPERVGKIVLTNTAAFPSRHIPRRIALLRNPLGAFLIRAFNLFALPAIFMATSKGMTATVRGGFLWPYDSWCSRAAIARFVRDIPMKPSDPSYATLEGVGASLERLKGKPVLIAWGGMDFCFDETFLREWHKRFPDARVRFYHNAGHYVLEDAGDEIIPEIRDFLAGATGEAEDAG
ncbi:MAG: alpha/beta fold hydrolase [Puniceicoccales bacterium]|jgi:haloalkane dehalogenase|nr:alpha/beta fold hydrolase [Puniceicoccales bacterium]